MKKNAHVSMVLLNDCMLAEECFFCFLLHIPLSEGVLESFIIYGGAVCIGLRKCCTCQCAFSCWVILITLRIAVGWR